MSAKDSMAEPAELRKIQEEWKNVENQHHNRAKKILINDFSKATPLPHDYFNIEPNNYNLSIVYNREKKQEDDASKKKDKKAKKEAKNRGAVAGEPEEEDKNRIEDGQLEQHNPNPKKKKQMNAKSYAGSHMQLAQALEAMTSDA